MKKYAFSAKDPLKSKKTTFRERVLDVVRHISKGETLSYKEVAKRAGNPRAARAVGAIMKTNYDPKIPCHRVIRSDGKPGGYNRGAANKARILEEERKI